MRVVLAAIAAFMVNAAVAAAQTPVTPGQPPAQVVPPTQAAPLGQEPQPPAVPGQPVPGTTATTPVVTRTFTAPTGVLFNTVRPDRVADFETAMWYLQQALQKSTDPTARAQAAGWRIFRATEAGPNNTVLYVFVLDPAVPRADYSLGRILADAYPEQIVEIWRMYRDSVTSGGSLLNLTPVEPMEPQPILPAPATGTGAKPITPGAPPIAPGAPRTPPPSTPGTQKP